MENAEPTAHYGEVLFFYAFRFREYTDPSVLAYISFFPPPEEDRYGVYVPNGRRVCAFVDASAIADVVSLVKNGTTGRTYVVKFY